MQRNDRITQILNELERIWKKYPELRLLQLIQSLYPDQQLPTEFFYTEDAELYQRLRAFQGFED